MATTSLGPTTSAGTAPVTSPVATPSLPPAAYTDPVLYEQELTEVYGRSWILVGHASEVARPGQYLTADVGYEPVVVVRGYDGVLRALSNVCRHRASTILEGAGTVKRVMRCPYHAWTYDLDGQLAAAPQARGFACLDRDSIALPQFQVEVAMGLVFCAVDPVVPLDEMLGPVKPFLETFALGDLEVYQWPGHGSRKDEVFAENWKILADNYLEDYHVPVAHPALVRLMDVKKTFGESNEWCEWSVLPLRSKPSRDEKERRYQETVRRAPGMPEIMERRWGHICIWPATFMELYPHHVDTWQLDPLGLQSTRARTFTLVHPDAGPDIALARDLCHELQVDVMAEDVDITTRVQRGVRAPSYQGGILNDEQEPSVVRFQTKLRELLPRIAELETRPEAQRWGRHGRA
jgi:Rieske 2Fe-2S family protein